MSEERARLKATYKSLYVEMEELLFRIDPIEINFESNTDEYSSEVGAILPRLKDAKSESDVLAIVREEFARWFSLSEDQLAGSKYREAATEIWRLWREHMEPSVKGSKP